MLNYYFQFSYIDKKPQRYILYMLLGRLENGNVFLYKSQKQGMLHLFGTNRANCCSSRVATESNPLNVSGNRYFPFT